VDFQPDIRQPQSISPPDPVAAAVPLTPPEPAAVPALPTTSSATSPVPVVRVLSPFGVEYVFMTICLFVGAIALVTALISLANGKIDFSVLAFPAATLLISVPVFAVLFLRLKKLELKRPELKLDPSKRRSTQFTQITAFTVVLFTLIGLVFNIFMKLGGQGGLPIVKAILDTLCILVVAGGILAYYWRNEHKRN
jgi:hypothetical protein